MNGKSLTSYLLGVLNESIRSFQERGWNLDDFKAIGTNDAMADELTEAMFRHRLFTTPTEQIQRLLEINEAVWKDLSITEQVIHELGDPPDCPTSDESGLYCVCLFNETGDVVKTFDLNYQALVHVHGVDRTWKWVGLLFTKKGVQQRAGAIVRPKGLRWQVAELGRQFQKQCVENVRPQLDQSQTMGMGQELPFVGALNPKWATSMDGDKIPFVDAPDLEVAPRGDGEFSYAPYLSFGSADRQVRLRSHRVGDADPNFGSGSLRWLGGRLYS